MARKKKADSPEQSQETPAIKDTTELHIPESGLMEETPSRNSSENEISDPNAATFKDDARAAIFAKRKEFLEKENGIIESGIIDAEPIVENAVEEGVQKIEDSPPSEPVTTKVTPATASIINEPIEKFPITVNGQIIEYTLDELKQQAQLGVGARQKFDEAARMRQDAQNLMFASQQNSQPQAQNNQITQQQSMDIPEAEPITSDEPIKTITLE